MDAPIPLTRGSEYRDLTSSLLVFWKTGCWEEVVLTKGLAVFLHFASFALIRLFKALTSNQTVLFHCMAAYKSVLS